MRTAAAVAAIVGSLVLPAGCIVQSRLEKPSQSGARWIELSSQHFTLATDLDASEATRTIRTFELAYALLARVVFGDEPAPDFRTEVLAFRSEGEVREFLPAPLSGRYMTRLANDIEPSPTMVVYGKLSPANRILFVHELAHRFNHVALGSMPVWFNEGLAQFYSTVRGDLTQPQVGALDPDAGFASGSVWSDPSHIIFQGALIDIADVPRPSRLMRLDRAGFYAGDLDRPRESSRLAQEAMSRNYAAAWALVHMLMSTESPEAASFQRVLRQAARTKNASAALEQASLDPVALDRQFDAYLKKAIPWREHHEGLPPVLGEVRQRELGEAATLVRWARLASLASPQGERFMRDAVAAAPEDPEVEFWFGRFEMVRGKPKVAERWLEAARAREPGNPAYQLALVALYFAERGGSWSSGDHDERLEEAMARLTKVARTPAELGTVAGFNILQGHADVALPLAARACEAGPDCWECFHSYALASYETEDAARALELERAALERLPEDAPSETARALQGALRRFEAAVSGSSVPSGNYHVFFPW
jgi:hypothetical protein